VSRPRSLRSRLLIGSAIWGGASLVGMSLITAVFVYFHGYREVAHWGAMVAGSIIFLITGLSMLQRGLLPFDHLRDGLAGVRDGRNDRVAGEYPIELQPLVDDLNSLLDLREQAVRRAIAKAGDLAHGLKTPLAVLSQEAQRAEAAGHHDLAASIAQQVDRMRRQMNYYLAHARAAASGATIGARTSVRESADGLARTLLRLHADRGLSIHVNVFAEHVVKAQREDVDEMLGNLLDNACKWAKSNVTVSSSVEGGTVVILVDDDGPGLDPQLREAVLRRGVRADEAAPGSGFGLAIVHDVSELYGGSIALLASPSGGVRAKLTLPAA
jgi:signal transduction histidine kinase